MEIRVLSAADVRAALDARTAVDAMRRAFSQLSSGEAVVPVRGAVESQGGVTLLMPAYLAGSGELGAKIVSAFPDNASRGEPAIQGAVIVLDASTGRPLALLDGTSLTAIRTAAGSALATQLLADPDADVLAVIGAGTQGESHIRALAAARRLREVRVLSRTLDGAERLVARLLAEPTGLTPPGDDGPPPSLRAVDTSRAALEGAGIVVAATTSSSPVFEDEELAPGAHINAVGSFRPDMQEVPAETVARARVVVDQLEAAWEEAGDLIVPYAAGMVDRSVVSAELGDIVLGRAPRGRGDRPVTLFKSVGNAAQDVAIAGTALAEAERAGLGRTVPF